MAKKAARLACTYHIDLNERGLFHAHVEDENGKFIYRITNEDEDEGAGEIPEVVFGYMKHGEDVDGLCDYLFSLGFIPEGATIRMEG